MTIHYLPTEAHMHTDEWPARRCSGPCDQGRRECQTPDACRHSTDWAELLSGTAESESRIIVRFVVALLLILVGVWAWRML